MNDFIIYSEKNAFDDVTFNGNYPNLKSIFTNHAKIFLNISPEELQEDLANEGVLFLYLHAFGGAKIPESNPNHFINILEDGIHLLASPRSLYILNISESQAETLQNSYGVLVQSSNSIYDDIFKGGFHKELPKQKQLISGSKKGWEVLFDFAFPPSNSIVITDDWLFKNEENGKIVGQENILSLLNVLLPNDLQVEYHILIITDDQGRAESKCENIANELRKSIAPFRKYPIIVEVVFADTIHKRKAILNYLSITCDKGFAMFRVNNPYEIRDDNDFRYEKIFNRMENNEGDTVFYSDTLILSKLKNKCISVKDYIQNNKQDPNRRILGDCNSDKSIKNRLINDV